MAQLLLLTHHPVFSVFLNAVLTMLNARPMMNHIEPINVFYGSGAVSLYRLPPKAVTSPRIARFPTLYYQFFDGKNCTQTLS